MQLHPEELGFARAYERQLAFEGLTQDQLHCIMERGRTLFKWTKGHAGFHNLLNLSVLSFIFIADWWILMRLPDIWLTPGGGGAWGAILVASLLAGGLHSYLMYTMIVFSMHEGAAHRLVFLGTGRVARFANFVGANLCRLASGEPVHYAATHMAHHAKFGVEGDAEFLNFVMPRRYWLTFLPFATFINYSDFVVHRPLRYTRSRVVSAFLGLSYQATFMVFCYRRYGLGFVLIAFFAVMPHVGFYLDRLRQFTEHNLLPLDNKNGSRNFGLGFWGLVVGGGPWGSPCHWSHHLVASLPWYQQLVLHRFIVTLLTPVQKKQFLIEPFVGFPKLWLRLVREPARFARLTATGSGQYLHRPPQSCDAEAGGGDRFV